MEVNVSVVSEVIVIVTGSVVVDIASLKDGVGESSNVNFVQCCQTG